MVFIKKFFKFLFDVLTSSRKDSIGAYTANAAFFITVSFVPFVMLLVSILTFLPLGEGQMIRQVASIFPAAAKNIVASVVAESYEQNATAVISITAVATLWAASMGVHSLTKGIDRIYNSDRPNSIIKLRIKSLVYTLVVFAVIILWLAVFVFGDNIAKMLVKEMPWTKGILKIIALLDTLWVFMVLFFIFLAMYTAIPSGKKRFIAQLPGAAISAVGCMGISSLFARYYEGLLGFSSVYGGLTIIVFFMLWLFFSLYTLFIGAEVNKCIGERLEQVSFVET